ncbi:hypothetical protein F4776DRAFT_618171 [Hypoxylon sp. NC0597]|nr:hypothetical protein F4776DRAFT_618171 [Hypoxylon sp. NC0597]
MGSTREYFELILFEGPWQTESRRTTGPLPPTATPIGTVTPSSLSAITANANYTVPLSPLTTLNTAPIVLAATGDETTAVHDLSATTSNVATIAPLPSVATQNATIASMPVSLPTSQKPTSPTSSPYASFYILALEATKLARMSHNSSDASGSVLSTQSNGEKQLTTSRLRRARQGTRMKGSLNTSPSESSGPESTHLSKKTTYEQSRGQQLRNKGIGRRARAPCNHCVNKPGRCCVAIDPQSFDSFKCAYCISNKVSCSFNFENPGLEYPPEMMSQIHEKEKMKKAGRVKAKQTNDKRKAKTKTVQAHETETAFPETTTEPKDDIEEGTSTDNHRQQGYHSCGWVTVNDPRH